MSIKLQIPKSNLIKVKELSVYDSDIFKFINPLMFDGIEYTHIRTFFQEQYNSSYAELGYIKDDKFVSDRYFEYCDGNDFDDADYQAEWPNLELEHY